MRGEDAGDEVGDVGRALPMAEGWPTLSGVS